MNDYYRQIRANNTFLRQKNIERVYAAIPEIASLKRAISDFAKLCMEESQRNPDDKERIGKRLADYIQKKEGEISRILTEHDEDLDFDAPIYTCRKCKDTGYVGSGKCSCNLAREIRKNKMDSHLQKLDEENFSTFRLDLFSTDPIKEIGLSPREIAESNLNIALQFVDSFPHAKNMLFLGMAGLGKSFLCNCIAHALLERGYTVLYDTPAGIYNRLYRIMNTQEKSALSEHDYMELLTSVDLLIIDDLGSEYENDFTTSQLYHIVNTRMLRSKPIIISTNYTMKGIAEVYPDRIFSRITSFTPVPFYGYDLRKHRKDSL